MKVLWIVNTIFPEVCDKLGINKPNVGGWMYALANDIKSQKGVNLAIASVYNGNEVKKFNIEGYCYYLIPSNNKNVTKYNSNMEFNWKEVYDDFNPEVVHIHGTEYPHGLAFLNAINDKNKVVASIQGLVSVYERYYYAGIDFGDIIKNVTLKDLLKFNSIISQRKKFEKRGVFERKIISQIPNVIGRTKWDYVHANAINKDIKYYFCNESLRDPFYKIEWNMSEIDRNTIFLSQAGYPIKGLHIVLKACRILKEQNQNIIINIAGDNIMKSNTLKDKIKIGGYSKYLNKLIKKYDLENNVKWLGQLDEFEMAKQMKKANLFLCPSSIENSPNSLGEAQLIGLPCIASYVGGVPDMIRDKYDGLLYRFEEYEMLAYNILKVLNDDILAMKLSENGKVASRERHDREKNLNDIIDIYKDIIKNNK